MSRRTPSSMIDANVAALERMAEGPSVEASESLSLRRWDAAATNRLNKAHWQDAQGQPINVDIAAHLPTLLARCAHEAETNPLVMGVIETHVTDLVGDTGPRLQVESDNPDYNEWLEAVWSAFWAEPDIEGELSGVEVLQLWVRMLWKAGAYLYRTLDDPFVSSDVRLRLRQYHPRRLVTPQRLVHDPYTVMGVQMHKTGRRKGYWIDQAPENDIMSYLQEPTFVPADQVGHRFQRSEPGQVIGVPWLAPCLQVVADVRDGDNEILDAVRNAADWSVLLEATDPGADFVQVNETADIQRRTMRTLPPGYKANSVKGDHPNTNYLAFRDERIRELGAPVQMPLLRVKHDASSHNYSSARFDDLGYWRGIARHRHWISDRDLRPLLLRVEREARLAQMSSGSPVPRPKDFESVKLFWHWPQPQRLDLNKEWSGIAIQRALGGLTFDQMQASTGSTRETFLAQEKRARADFEKAGIPYPELDQILKAVQAMQKADAGDEPAKPKRKQEAVSAA